MQDLAPITKAPSLVEQVCSQLASRLHSTTSSPAQKLPAERILAAQLGVSRSVLREAIKRLELQGLLEIRQGRGTKVVNKLQKPLSAALTLLVPGEADRLLQLFEVRLLLEPESARLAAQRSTPAQLEKMRDSLRALREAPSVAEAIHADLDFHRAIAEASGNKILLLIIESLADLLAASHGKGFQSMSISRSADMHQDILHAIESRNALEAEAAMKGHLEEARSALSIEPLPAPFLVSP